VAGCLELSQRKNFVELNPMDRRFSQLCHKHPALARTFYRSSYALSKVAPKTFVKFSIKKLSAEDISQIYSEPMLNFVAPAQQALRHPKGLVEEYEVFTQPWGLKGSQIKAPTHIWQGRADTFVTYKWAEVLHQQIPHSKLHLIDHAGHFVAHQKISQILADL
jgi:pimeloyl-ACP methyl ester carboxylesterase